MDVSLIECHEFEVQHKPEILYSESGTMSGVFFAVYVSSEVLTLL
jgi:hypothetical protein